MLTRNLLISATILLAASAFADDDARTFKTAEQQATLLELYTSEGCSSCPPAKTWLSRLTDTPQLWRDFVPVAFHVNYWDYLGWQDLWGAEQFSARQRAYGAKWRSGSIYTPEFVLNGKEWRGWSGRKTVPKSFSASVGILTVTITNTGLWQICFTPMPRASAAYEAHAVWLVSDVTSDVKAGENRGRRLKHDFAALTLIEAPMKRGDDGFECQLHLPKPTLRGSGRLAVAVCVTEMGKLEPLQATGGWWFKP